MEVAVKVQTMLNEGKSVRDAEWNAKETEWINTQFFLTAKPVVYLVNIGKKEYISKKNKWLPKVQAWI